MKRLTAASLVLCFGLVGCTGSFNLTRKVYDFHRSQDDQWMDEFAFLVVSILPIYGIATFADAIIFNSIEFWTGDNPVASGPKGAKFVKNGSEEGTLQFDNSTEQVTFKAGAAPELVFEKNTVRDKAGNVLYTSVLEEGGDIALYNADMQLVKRISSNDVASMKAQIVR